MSSRIFKPFRAIGCCSDSVPLSLSCSGKSSLVATAVGKAFHVYECNKLHLVVISRLQDDGITCLVQDKSNTYAAVGNEIKLFTNGEETYAIESGRVHILSLLGQQLVSVNDSNCLCVWDIVTREPYTEIQWSEGDFAVTALVHPSTYLNKVVVGSEQGSLQLWNIRTNKLIYTFAGWSSAVLTLVQSTALDVLGVGLADGRVLLHNIREDETLIKLRQDWGPVTSLAFRTDGVDTLVSGSSLGHLAVWDLNEQRLCSVLHNAHSDSIAGAEFFPQQPVLITNSIDNSIKMWIFDQSDGSGRLLKERCGHSAPPTLIRFHPTARNLIISSGLDQSLRLIVLHRQTISRELSQGSLIKKGRGLLAELRKLPQIIDFACESHRQNEWDSIVTVHRDLSIGYTWNLMNYSLGKHAIKSNGKSLCCSISACGHFMLLGTETGHVQVFNIQSGIFRGELTHRSSPAHNGPVRGIATTIQYIVTGGADGTIKVWSFQRRNLVHTVSLESPLSHLVLHRESGLVGVACDNFRLKIVDIESGRIVRLFEGPSRRITDLAISADSRWLVCSAMDCSITTWDIPTGQKIDLFYCQSPAVSITLSSTGNFLATCHVDELGIFLWSNSTLYSSVSLTPLPADYNPSVLALPSTGVAPVNQEDNESLSMDLTQPTDESDALLRKGLITLSSLSKSQWHGLQFMDIIKERNKPKEPVQPAKPAPFFLPTQPGLELKFLPAPDPISSLKDDSRRGKSKILNKFRTSQFQDCLMESYGKCGNFSEVIDLLKSMGPAAVDLEFQLLGPEQVGGSPGGDDTLLETVLRFLLEGLKTRDNFELIQSYLCLILKYYTGVLCTRKELKTLLTELLQEHQLAWKELSYQLNYCNTLLSYCKSATV